MSGCEFNQDNGIHILQYGNGHAIGEMIITSKSLNPYGTVHGGLIAAFLDNIGCLAAFDGKDYFVTQTVNVTYMRPASGNLTARGERIYLGKKSAVARVDILDENGGLIAEGTMTMVRVAMDSIHLIDDLKSKRLGQQQNT